MNRLVIAAAIASSLFFIPGCSTPTTEASLNESSEVEEMGTHHAEGMGDGHHHHITITRIPIQNILGRVTGNPSRRL